MSALAGTDRNLLFGILALQMDFVTRDQLVAGMNAWVLEKAKPLGTILQEQGALDHEHHELLSALVQAHLKKHNNDAEQSLAAVPVSPWLQQQIKSLCHPDLEASLAHLGGAAGDDDHATRSFAVGESSSAGTRFRILRPHAEGGLGKVSVALDEELHREVALKEIKERHADDPSSRGRFVLEAEITGGLEHPGVVPVYGLGNYADGRPFYAMRFIRGDSLKEAIERFHAKPVGQTFLSAASATGTTADKNVCPTKTSFNSLEFRQLLGRFVDVCNAIAYAHSRGVLHRDLKPGNIMLGKYGETLVVDWGLAKAVGSRQEAVGSGKTGEPGASATGDEPPLHPSSASGSAQTIAGTAIGTPAFMSPEQAAGRLDRLGPASDIYSLGATLFALLTGQPPLKDLPTPDMLRRVEKGDIPPPRRVNPAIPLALEAICMKAMALRPSDRYGSPRALADDIEHWLADEPVSAWPEPWTVKTRRFFGRHRTLAATAAAVLVVGALSVMVSNLALSKANHDLVIANETISQREEETKSANTALATAMETLSVKEKETQEANRNLEKAIGEIAYANKKLTLSETSAHELAKSEKGAREKTELTLATTTMMLARSRFEENNASLAHSLMNQIPLNLRRSSWRLLKHSLDESRFTLGGTSIVSCASYSPDGQLVASAGHDKTVRLWDSRSGSELRTLSGHQGKVFSVAFSPDGRLLASGSADLTIIVWDVQTGKRLRSLPASDKFGVGVVSFSPDGRFLASTGGDAIKVWHTSTWQQARTLAGHKSGAVADISFSPDGEVLASASGGREDGNIKLWDMRSGQQLRSLHGSHFGFHSVSFSPNQELLASASHDGSIKLWNAKSGQEVRTMRGHGSKTGLCVVFSPDGQLLASTGSDGVITLWDVATGKTVCALRGHQGTVNKVAFSPNGQMLVSAGDTVKLWQVRPERELRTIVGHRNAIETLSFAPDGQTLASGSRDGTIICWDVWSGQELRTLTVHRSIFGVNSIAFHARGDVLASGSFDLKLWDVRNGKEIRALRGHERAVTSVAFGRNGDLLVSGSVDRSIKLWDTRTGKELRTLRGHKHFVNGIALSPDGMLLASASADGTVRVWDVVDGHAVHIFHDNGSVRRVAFNLDGTTLASCGDETIKLWNVKTGQEIGSLHGHQGPVQCVAFSPNGELLASSSALDDSVRVWDVKTNQEIRHLRGHKHMVHAVVFSPDGTLLASSDNYRTIKLWDVRSGQNIATVDRKDVERSDNARAEIKWRRWITVPDLHYARELADIAQVDKNHFAAGFHLGWYLAGQEYYRDERRTAAAQAGWLGLAHQPLVSLGSMNSLAQPTFDRGGVFAGILAKKTGPGLERVRAEAAKGVAIEPQCWLNRALYGAALYRAGDYPQALKELNRAVELRGKAGTNVWLTSFLSMTHAKLNQQNEAKEWLVKLAQPKDAPWEETALHDLLRPEVETLVKAK